MKDATQVIIRPLITEKTTTLQHLNTYTFEVAKDATKVDVRNAVEQLGGCEVARVNTLIVKGKFRRTRRGRAKRPDWKKAMVTLAEGEALGGILGQVFDQV
jgi:large subunit ribosomal protein L23